MRFNPQRFVVKSRVMREVEAVAATVARRRSTVLLQGETGSGKEMVARHIHDLSDRADGPFVPVDCAAVIETLFESQLFGHARGAFTGAVRESLGFIRAADGGTLFLDEVGELPMGLQAKLLRVIQERQVVPVGETRPRPVDVRIIAATHRDLAARVREGRFREDLYFRLNVVGLRVPPLRERREDILPLAEHFLAAQAAIYEEPCKALDESAARALERYHWPGNVRELANAMEHAYVLATGQVIGIDDLPEAVTGAAETTDPELDLRTVERLTILKALKRTRNRKAAAARLLGINVQRLNRRIERLQIPL